jgi:hypothetical protein
MPGLDIFITYGHNEKLKDQLVEILQSIDGFTITTYVLKDILQAGDSIPSKLEEYSIKCDLSIILATEDDYVATKNSDKSEPHARQNVWMEYGFFWAKLGLSRTLLLAQESIAIPTNIGDNYFILFKEDIYSIRTKIVWHIQNLSNRKSGNLTEMLYLNNDPNQLSRDWRELHELSHYRLIITGISFGNMRHDLPELINKVVKCQDLHLVIVAADPYFVFRNRKLFKLLHGANAVQDNLTFFNLLNDVITKVATSKQIKKAIKSRLKILLFSGYSTGATVYCEDKHRSQHMIFQPFTYRARDRRFDSVRFRLKKRAINGAFDSIYNSLNVQITLSKPVELFDKQCSFLKEIKSMLKKVL